MTQAASSPTENGGAPGSARGQGPGAGELAREEIKKIREKMIELRLKLYEARENGIDVSKQRSILSWLETKLDLIAMYFTLVEIEQHALAGTLDGYMRNRLRQIIVELSVDDIEDPLFHAVKDKAEHVQKLVDSMSTIGVLETQLDEIAKAIRKLEKEVLAREGWDVE